MTIKQTIFGFLSAATAALGASSGQDAFGAFLKNHSASDRADRAYEQAVRRTAEMVGDADAQRLVGAAGLNLMNLTWEDTGRYKGSSVGPNISDMTIEVGLPDGNGGRRTTLMPVIRHPNFEDITGDLDPRAITLLVGNQSGRSLQRISLYDFLAQPTRFLSDPRSWPARRPSLLAPRDTRVLASAQACFLPVPREGLATFNPVLFNYQSMPGQPAVLAILATRQGTSVTVIENRREDAFDGNGWGQRLFHNDRGQRTSLTGQRLSDYNAEGRPDEGTGEAQVSDDALNMVMLIQVPLKVPDHGRAGSGGDGALGAPMSAGAAKMERSDVENAVIGHGEWEGPFKEINGLKIERDPRFPVRVTVQFYKATSNGVVDRATVRQVRNDIDRVYKAADSVGSLVTGGHTGRVTEYDGAKVMPRDWWEKFWERYESWSDESRWSAQARLRKLLGQGYEDRPVCDLYLRDVLRRP